MNENPHVTIAKSTPDVEKSKYPWKKIQIGESFFITVVNNYPQMESIRSECSRRNKVAKTQGHYFAPKKVRDGLIGERIEVAKKSFPRKW